MPWYATREALKAALDSKEPARNDAAVDRALEGASRRVEDLVRRTLHPRVATRRYDYSGSAYRLDLDDHLASLASLTSGGVTLSTGDLLLYPDDGPPYRRIEVDRSSSSALDIGDTEQQTISVTGTWGWSDDTVDAGLLAEDLDASETKVDVTDASLVGVGDLLLVGTEWMEVAGRSMLSSAQTNLTALTASMTDNVVVVTTGSAFHVGEVLLLGAEKVRVDEVAGNNLAVRRAWDGTTLAAHTGATIYVGRTLTVVRGAVGSTAATHLTSAAIGRWAPPGAIVSLCLAEAEAELLASSGGWSGERGAALEDLRNQVYLSFAHRCRTEAV